MTPEQDDFINFPDLPNENQLRSAIDKTIELEEIGIDWGSIKETDKLRSKYSDQIDNTKKTVTINNYVIPLSEKGIELEWWDKKYPEEQLKLAIPENIRDYQDLNVIHQTTGGVLEYVFKDHTVSNMVPEEIHDWLRKEESLQKNIFVKN